MATISTYSGLTTGIGQNLSKFLNSSRLDSDFTTRISQATQAEELVNAFETAS